MSSSDTIIPFHGRAQKACELFVAEARGLPIFQKAHPYCLDFDSIRWDLFGHVKGARTHSSLSIAFKTSSSPAGHGAISLPGRLGDAIKAVVACKLWATRGDKTNKSGFQYLTDCGRRIYEVLLDEGIDPDPTQVTGDHLDKALARAGKSERHLRGPMDTIGRIWGEAGIAPSLQDYQSSGGSRGPRSRLRPKRSRQSLSNLEIFAIADAFHSAVELT